MRIPRLNIDLKNLDLKRFASPDPQTSRTVIMGAAVAVLFMGIAALTAFFLSLRGQEQTMVPDLRGAELANALISMQEKELYPRIQLRFSDDPKDSGTVLEQNPGPGAIVKAGRRINLVISRGAQIDKVENFIGQDLGGVKLHLQTLFNSSARPLLAIKEPPIYVFDPKPAGTVLAQKPVPDTPLSQPAMLELVVSRGPEAAKLLVPALMGMRADEALKALGDAKASFTFTSRKAEGKEAPFSVVSQLPAAGASVPPSTRVAIVVTEADKSADLVFGLMKQSLPEYPYPLALNVTAILSTGDKKALFDGPHSGGEFSIPYLLPPQSQLVLSILGQEKFRMEVKAP
jgi:eukaryotic-like serine/threonine-protein kinase